MAFKANMKILVEIEYVYRRFRSKFNYWGHSDVSGFLWTAPELLRMQQRPPEGTQKGDVYSFAVICQEIVYRMGVFFMSNIDLGPAGLLFYRTFLPKDTKISKFHDAIKAIVSVLQEQSPFVFKRYIKQVDFQQKRFIIRK